MQVYSRDSLTHNLGETFTIQTYGSLLKLEPEKIFRAAVLNPELTNIMVTEGIHNMFKKSKKASDQYTEISSYSIIWTIEVNYIKKIDIVSNTGGVTPGKYGRSFDVVFAQPYFDEYDAFRLENSGQILHVSTPRVQVPGGYKHSVKLISNNPDEFVNPMEVSRGAKCRWFSTYHPELSDVGYTKFISNSEKFANFMSRHRHGASRSSDFAAIKSKFYKVGKGAIDKESSYAEMFDDEKLCLDNFQLGKEHQITLGHSNFDQNGKCLTQDTKGRDIPSGDGIVPQIEKHCARFGYTTLTPEFFNNVVNVLVAKKPKLTGNTFLFESNNILWQDFNKFGMEYFTNFVRGESSLLFQKENQKVKMGAEFVSYSVGGNTVLFTASWALTQFYDQYGFGLFIDQTADKDGRPNIAGFTFKGSDIITGTLIGLGGRSGTESGEMSTLVAGNQFHMMGFSAVAVFNPHTAAIIKESVARYL